MFHLSPHTSPGLIAPPPPERADADTGDGGGGGAGGRGLRDVMVSGLPDSEKTHELVAVLHQRSWALRLQALMMLRLQAESAQV